MQRAKHPRPRGFAPWNPRADGLALVSTVSGVLAEYADYLPLTLRQVFYRLVGAHGYEKTERAYKRLGETLNRARRARLIPFDAIRDDGLYEQTPNVWQSVAQVEEMLRYTAATFRLDRQSNQPIRTFLWSEASGMVPMLAGIVSAWDVPVLSSGGFDSVTVKHALAERLQRAGAHADEVHVLHIGDHDPSGCHAFLALEEDVLAFGCDGVWFFRIAVTPAQIEAYRLPTAPAKPTDNRVFSGRTAQAEALPPDVLAKIVRDAVSARIDAEALLDMDDAEIAAREQLAGKL